MTDPSRAPSRLAPTRGRVIAKLGAFATACLPAVALAAEPPLAAPLDPVAIAGGQTVEPCGWPSVVLLQGNGYLCTGNLVHPEIVVTAAHCLASMGDDTVVEFGDTANTAQPKVEVEYCTGSPDYVDTGDGTIPFAEVANDWGFCKLASPVTDVEPIPVIYGCELDLIAPGTEIVRVGYGRETLSTSQFFKRWVQTQINEIPFTGANGWPTQLTEGGNGQGTCPGDSGGPSFIRIPAADGGEDDWRMVAIQSTQPLEDAQGNEIECGDAPNNTAVISQAVEFIESESGIDITPCFDTAGGWDAGFDCQGFPIDPSAGGGTWAMGCDPGPVSGFSAACGVAFDVSNPDESPPAVAIVDPASGTSAPYNGAPVAVYVEAEADDGPSGWGIAHVELVILSSDGVDELGRFDDVAAPWSWDPAFPQGSFVLRAIATDNAGLQATSDDVHIDIGVASDDSDGTEGAADGSTGIDEGGADGTGGDFDPTTGGGGIEGSGGITGGLQRGDETGGCGCVAGPGRGGPGLGGGLALVVVGMLRRRRR